MLNHYRNIKRKHFDHHVVEDFVKVATREKRAASSYRGQPSHSKMFNIIQAKSDFNSRSRRSVNKREGRDYSDADREIDKAYSKYYEKIKARYRNYVKNLFPIPKTRGSQHNNSFPMQPMDEVKNTKKIQVQDGRWYNSHNNPEFRYRATLKSRTISNDLQNEEYENEMGPPVALPSINDPIKSNRFPTQHNYSMSNNYPSYAQQQNEGQFAPKERFNEGLREVKSSAEIAANIFAQLQTQMVRRKRDLDDSLGN